MTILAKNLEDTAQIAQVIASFLTLEDVVILEGNLGAGKTHFVKFAAAALGYKGLVTSPTYTIASFYDLEKGKILHIDGYRLSGLFEFIDLGLDAYFDQSIMFVEWADEFYEEFPAYLRVKLAYVDEELDARKITISYTGERWENDFKSIEKALKKITA